MKCKKCKMDIPNGAKVCPYCKSSQGIGCGGAIVVIVLIVIGLSIVGGIGSQRRKSEETSNTGTTIVTSSTATTSATTSGSASPDESKTTSQYQTYNGFIIGNRQGAVENGICTVVGVIGNDTGRDCEYVSITIGFYSENGVKITSGIDNVLNLKKGETWQYTVYGFGDNIKTFKIEDIEWY